jgi:hypothetical protein
MTLKEQHLANFMPRSIFDATIDNSTQDVIKCIPQQVFFAMFLKDMVKYPASRFTVESVDHATVATRDIELAIANSGLVLQGGEYCKFLLWSLVQIVPA